MIPAITIHRPIDRSGEVSSNPGAEIPRKATGPPVARFVRFLPGRFVKAPVLAIRNASQPMPVQGIAIPVVALSSDKLVVGHWNGPSMNSVSAPLSLGGIVNAPTGAEVGSPIVHQPDGIEMVASERKEAEKPARQESPARRRYVGATQAKRMAVDAVFVSDFGREGGRGVS